LTAAALGWSISLWMVMIFATCVAHTLLHGPGPNHRRLGHVLAGMAGYPLLGYEHVRHHQMSGNTRAAECPCMDESVWHFAARRLRVLSLETISSQGLVFRGDARSASVRGLRLSIACTAATASVFAFNAGWVGLAIYCTASALVNFSIQLVTYMQHWGLGDDHLADARAQRYSWDSDCRLQAWLTIRGAFGKPSSVRIIPMRRPRWSRCTAADCRYASLTSGARPSCSPLSLLPRWSSMWTARFM